MTSPRVIHTRLLFWAAGMAVTARLVLIHPSRRDDVALLAHEHKHCEQLRAHGALGFWWQYLASPFFRQAMEVEAFRVQVALKPSALDACAQALSTRYFLRLSADQARALLLQPSR